MEKHLHKLFADLENHRWWSVGIRQIQLFFVKKYLPVPFPEILDIGCGPGATLKELSKLGHTIGIDNSKYALQLAKQRGLKNIRYGDVLHLPFSENSFHIVTAFDVIEHVDDDIKGLTEIKRVMKKGGIVIFTSPAYMWLYDDHDRMNHHFRRYTTRKFIEKAKNLGLNVRFCTYCNTFLFPFIVLVKVFNRIRGMSRFNNEDTPEPLNSILKLIFSSERYVLNMVPFPFGLSILAVLEKPLNEG